MLTPQEQELLDRTTELWNSFLDLPVQREHDAQEMARDIHAIQHRIMIRVTRRLHPDRFLGTQQ